MNKPSLIQTWRRFSFFDRERVKDPENAENPFMGFQDLNVLCCASGRNGTVFIGETDGSVHHFLSNKDFESDYFRAHKTLMYQMAFCAEKNLLITVGEDGPGVNPFLKVWNMEKIDKNGIPFCCRCSKVGPGTRTLKPTALAIGSNVLAVAFEDSTLLLYKGDYSKGKQTKHHMVRDGLICSEDGAIIALVFQSLPNDKSSTILYLGTSHVIAVYSIGAKEKDVKLLISYRESCYSKCWALGDSHPLNQFIVARREGVYFYDTGSKGGFQLFDGEKLLIKTLTNYLLIVYRDVNTIEVEQKEKMNLLTIYDMCNSYIAYSAPIPQVLDVFYAFGAFYIITKSGHLFELIEKDNKAKLEILFRKNLYDLAVKLAESSNFTDDSLVDIYMQYGEFLYAKNDYQNAVKQFIKTIGKIEPSTIIKKFLDSQRIEQMTEYLEALHKTEFATQDHTTILLNCYTKMSDSAKIDKFIKASSSQQEFDSVTSSGTGYLDVETGIRVLKEAGYLDQAVLLTKKHKLWNIYLAMLVEDVKDYDAAVTCIKSMNFKQALENIKLYGKILIAKMPEETLELLKNLCSGFKNNDDKCDAQELWDILINSPNELMTFLEFVLGLPAGNQPSTTYHTLLELYLKTYKSTTPCNQELFDKIMAFLRNNYARMEFDKALILCREHEFNDGLTYLYEKADMPKQLLQHFVQNQDFDGVLNCCRKYGTDNKEMWTDALWFFSRSTDTPDSVVEGLLKHVDQQRVLPPLMVLEILSHSPKISLGVVKTYLMNWLHDENSALENYRQQISCYKREIEKNQSIINDIQTNAQVFQISKCSACDTPLETPSVHFLCKHSFHQHCFESYTDKENECPACAPENKRIRASSLEQEQSRDIYQQFKNDLFKTSDAISTLADYISKGAFHSGATHQLSLPSKTVASSSTTSKIVATKPEPLRTSQNPFDDDEPHATTNPFEDEDD